MNQVDLNGLGGGLTGFVGSVVSPVTRTLGAGVNDFVGATNTIGTAIGSSSIAQPALSLTNSLGAGLGHAYYDFASAHPCIAMGVTIGFDIAAFFVAPEEEGAVIAEENGAELAAGWRGTNMSDEDSFNYHFGKHGVGKAPQQYAQDARDWAANPTGIATPVKLADGTTGVRYRTPGGGPGGILDSNGKIVTFWYR